MHYLVQKKKYQHERRRFCCSKLFQKSLFLKRQTALSVLKTKTQKTEMFHAAATSVLLLLFRKLQDITSFYSNLFKKLLLLKRYYALFVPKKSQHERQRFFHASAPLVLFFLTWKLRGFASSCSKLFEKQLLLKCQTALSFPKKGIGSSSFGPSFFDWEIAGPYKFLFKNN